MFRAISVLMFAAFFAAMSACAIDAADEPLDGEPLQEEVDLVEPQETGVAKPVDDGASLAANCSQIQYCNAPGSVGTRCQQLGCSFNDALYECVVETSNVCGTRQCIWEFVEGNGNRWHEGSCIGGSPGWWYLQ